MPLPIDYSNHSDRPTGAFLTALGRMLPGVRAVQQQVGPYADWWESTNREASDGDAPLWVAIGDSMTLGIGASAPDHGMVGQLSEQLAASGWHHAVVNLGVNGARVQDVLDRQLPVLERLADEGRTVGLVTVVIGSNDIVLSRHREGVVQRFRLLLDKLPPGAVVANLPNPRREAREIDALIRQRAASGEVVLADMRAEGPKSWRGRLAGDLFHPNDLGYAEMATVLENAIAGAGLPVTDAGSGRFSGT
ncbi:SGNH/GDSL hydrolase family protein [Humibacillus sp. DSM 29435]|uniref:SGNH/GDSL hydrolase family protein n=1 Tax=Humibacillus sp. DSM 29435 TaxID=1869167 RepID=UPI001586074E|nr:SGNH/GDSL hydrolase family protein [Humibacillus sp. DSM 29435]